MDDLIDACYAAAAEPDLWPVTLDRVGAVVGALGLVVMNQDRPDDIIPSASLSEANETYLSEDWWQMDTRNARGRAASVRSNSLILDRDLITMEEKRTDPFFQDFSARYGLGEFAGYITPDPSGGRLSVGAFRSDGDGGYRSEEVDLLLRIGPHLARAYTLTKVLADARAAASNAAAALEHARVGMITLDRRGRARQINAVAEGLLPGYLRLHADRRLQAVLPGERDRLDRRIASALSGGADAAAGSMLLKGIDGRRPLAVEVVPLRGVAGKIGSFGSREEGVLVVVRDLLAAPSHSIEPQLRRVGLTPAEARVAILIGRGRSPNDVADQFAVSRHTVRVQLRSVFMKLGVHRQSELAAMIARLEGLDDRGIA